jgi:hypothetical protein
MLDNIVRGLRQRAEASTTGNARKSFISSDSSDGEKLNEGDVGYSPSELLPLEQIEGVMTELIGMRLNEGNGRSCLQSLSH